MQRALSAIFPEQCILCSEMVEDDGGLCGACWRGVPFIRGLACDACGSPLLGARHDADAHCDSCLSAPPVWHRGRAALSYREGARALVHAFKYYDRPELALKMADWLAQAGRPILKPGTLLVPVPLHWSRLLTRRYNQAVELARALAVRTKLDHCPDALVRERRTLVQFGLDRDARLANVQNAFRPHPKRLGEIEGRDVCLIDDVMTSGATLSAAAKACLAANARQVSVLVLARAEKAP